MPQSVRMLYRIQLTRPDDEVIDKALEQTPSNMHRSVPHSNRESLICIPEAGVEDRNATEHGNRLFRLNFPHGYFILNSLT